MTQVDKTASTARVGPSGSRWPYIAARISTAGMAALALAQVVFAGEFLNGHFPALHLHALTATALMVVALVQVIVVIFVHRAGGSRWLLPIGVLVAVLVQGERALGETRLIGLHVPVGVVLVAGIWQMTWSVWRTPIPPRRPTPVGEAPS